MRKSLAGVATVFTIACASSPPPSEAPVSPASSTPQAASKPAGASLEKRLDVRRWRVVERESGPDNYYSTVDDAEMPFIRAQYKPPMKTTVLGYELDDDTRKYAVKASWKWRAITLPNAGDVCVDERRDSAAAVYFIWKSGLKYYTLKYVWSAVSPKGSVCDRKRNPFVAQDTIVLESGGASSAWKSAEIDLKQEFRKHFEAGKADADVPGFLGVGILTDGDQTQSESAADYADFVIVRAR